MASRERESIIQFSIIVCLQISRIKEREGTGKSGGHWCRMAYCRMVFSSVDSQPASRCLSYNFQFAVCTFSPFSFPSLLCYLGSSSVSSRPCKLTRSAFHSSSSMKLSSSPLSSSIWCHFSLVYGTTAHFTAQSGYSNGSESFEFES